MDACFLRPLGAAILRSLEPDLLACEEKQMGQFLLAFLAAGLFFLLIAAGTRLWHRLLAPREASPVAQREW